MYILFPLGVAYRIFELVNEEDKWLRDVTEAMAEETGWKETLILGIGNTS